MDLVATCDQLPRPGQTLSADGFAEIPGGKGANQAVAAARAGGRVRMMGCVGDDGFARRLLATLQDEGIDCRGVRSVEQQSSGVAIILVDAAGQNQIVVVPGANGRVSTQHLGDWKSAIADSDVLLLQLEVPVDTVRAAINLAQQCNTKVILDPAPAPNSIEGLTSVDLICPNETEAAALTGRPVETDEDVAAAAQILHQKGARAVAITLGARGVGFHDGQRFRLMAAPRITAVDTTAAGDAFAGALAVRWAETEQLQEAVRWGIAAGSIAATRPGAQPGMPTRDVIEAFLTEHPPLQTSD